MSALFNFQSLLTVILLLICTCTYLRAIVPSLLDRNKVGELKLGKTPLYPVHIFGKYDWTLASLCKSIWVVGECRECSGKFITATIRLMGTFWKCARIGERKSPFVALSCILMANSILFWS